MDEDLKINDVNSESGLQKTPEEQTKDLFQKEEDLLKNINPDFSSSAKEEFDEMKKQYEKDKSRNIKGLKEKLNTYKNEFTKDIN